MIQKSRKHLSIKKSKIYPALLLLSTLFILLYYSSNIILFDSDSGFEFINAEHIILKNSAEPGPIIQQFFYSTILLFLGINYKFPLIMQSILSIILILVMTLFTEYITNKRNLSTYVTLVTLQIPTFYWPSYSLKQYPLFLLFLTFFLYYFNKFQTEKKLKFIFLSAFFLSIGVLTHLICVPFTVFVFLYYLLGITLKEKDISIRDVIYFYTTLGLLLSPYIFWRLVMNKESLANLLVYPVSWGVMKYGKIVNIYFWKMPHPFTLSYIYATAILLLDNVMIISLFPLLLLGIFRNRKKNLLMFYIVWFFCLISPYLIGRGVLSYMYAYPFIPFVVVPTVCGISTFLDKKNLVKNKLPSIVLGKNRKIIKKVIIILFVTVTLVTVFQSYTIFSQRLQSLNPVKEDIIKINQIVPQNAKVLFRSYAIAPLLPQREILMISKDLSETEAVTYLNWTSNTSVANIFERYKIDYVIIYKDLRWERSFYVWFKLKYGYYPRHYVMIEESSYFTKVLDGRYFKVYKYISPAKTY